MHGDKKFTNKIWERFCVQRGMRTLSGTILGFSPAYGLGMAVGEGVQYQTALPGGHMAERAWRHGLWGTAGEGGGDYGEI